MILDELGAAPVILALLYLVAFIYAATKVHKLQRGSPGLDTRKLFAMSILLSCLTRFMGFFSIGALNFQSIRIGRGGGGGHGGREEDPDYKEDANQRFYEKTVLVLFDFPDFIIISAYVLLAVVWAESFLHSRRHWLSARVYRRNWLTFYLVFNSVLYAGQVLLYSLLFLPNVSRDTTMNAIFSTLCVINFFLPVLLLSIFFYLSCAFSGFPYKSASAMRRLQRVGRAVLWWTLGRIIWGIFALTTVLGYPTLFWGNLPITMELYSVLIVALFLVTELAPFALALEESLLSFLGSDDGAAAAPGSSSTHYSAIGASGGTPGGGCSGGGGGGYGSGSYGGGRGNPFKVRTALERGQLPGPGSSWFRRGSSSGVEVSERRGDSAPLSPPSRGAYSLPSPPASESLLDPLEYGTPPAAMGSFAFSEEGERRSTVR